MRLRLALWESGVHEARILAAFVDEPEKVTREQMDAWVAEFDSWDLCDQVCGSLFDRTPFAEAKIRQWAKDEREFVRRAAFALLADVRRARASGLPDERFLDFLPLIERHASDPRNFVKKAVNWALRQIGKRSLALHKPGARARRETRRVSRPKCKVDRQGCGEGAFRPEADRTHQGKGKLGLDL